MKKSLLLISVVTFLVLLVSCSGGTCQKEAMAYLNDSISLLMKSPNSFHYDKPEIVRETDSTFLAKVRIYGNNSIGNEICKTCLYLYQNSKRPNTPVPIAGMIIPLDSERELDKYIIKELREAYMKDEELKKTNPEEADTTSNVDRNLMLNVRMNAIFHSFGDKLRGSVPF